MVQKTKDKVVMSRSSDSSNLKTKSGFKGVLYNRLNGYDDSDNEEQTLFDRGPEVHCQTNFRSSKHVQSNHLKFKGKSSKPKRTSSGIEHAGTYKTSIMQAQYLTRTTDPSIEMSELRSRKSASDSSQNYEPLESDKPSFIERNISKGDTLQSIALKYSCQV